MTFLHSDSEFLVKEEKLLDYILAGLCFAIFLYGLVHMIISHFKNDYADYLYLLAVLPAIFFIKKGNSKRVYIRINKKGIYQDEKLVTSWKNFHNAYITQKKAKYISIKDNFILVVEYLNDGSTKGSRRNIPLTNSQNKSEEDVLAAVRFFAGKY